MGGMRIAVVGTGAVGGYFGGRLAAAGLDVTFLARGRHLEALRGDGLFLVSPKGNVHLRPVKATDRPSDVGPVDYVLLAVKMYDVEAAAAALAPLLGPATVVITLQNGVDAVDLVSRHVGRERVAAGAAYIVVVLDAPGRIVHTTADGLVFGELDGSRSRRLVALEAAGRQAGFGATASEAIEVDLWTKFVRLATWGGMTTVTRSPVGVIREDPALMSMMMSAIEEAMTVGRARGIRFPGALVDETLDLVHGFPFESKSSMLHDLELGRRLELQWLNGAVVRLGREAGVPTPIHEFITTVLGPFASGH